MQSYKLLGGELSSLHNTTTNPVYRLHLLYLCSCIVSRACAIFLSPPPPLHDLLCHAWVA